MESKAVWNIFSRAFLFVHKFYKLRKLYLSSGRRLGGLSVVVNHSVVVKNGKI